MTKMLSPILAEVSPGYVAFGCPGCMETHVIPVSTDHHPGRSWGWNGDALKPTFTPSIHVKGLQTEREGWEWTGEWVRGADGQPLPQSCHSFVREGQIQFLGDCSHNLAGQTVDIPAYPERSS